MTKRDDRSTSDLQQMELQAVLWLTGAIMEAIGMVHPDRDPVGVTKVLGTNSATHYLLQVLSRLLYHPDRHKSHLATIGWGCLALEAVMDQTEAEAIRHVVAAVMGHLEEDTQGLEVHLHKVTWDEAGTLVRDEVDSIPIREGVVATQWVLWQPELQWEWLEVLWLEDNKEGRRPHILHLGNMNQPRVR